MTNDGKRALVTGGAGYIGSHTVLALLEAGWEVSVIDDLSTGHRAAVPERSRLVVGSYGDRVAVTRLLTDERIDAILHCGARSLVGESMREPARYYEHNVVGGVALLDATRDAGVRRLVFSSTAAVYGIPDATPIDEDAPLRPINAYGETKRAFEGALRTYAVAYGLRSVSLRYFNVAGATETIGEDHDPETHLIPNVLRAALDHGPLTVFGDDYPTPDGTAIRDYIHVADLADAHLAALEATASDDPRTGATADEARALVCNLGNGDGFSVREVLATAEAVIGRPIPHGVGPRRAGDPPVLVASATRAGTLLGWRPRRPDLADMVASAWSWRLRNPGGYPD
jgi:UDP-glucose 4-epimerase